MTLPHPTEIETPEQLAELVDALFNAAHALVERANEYGLVLTISTVPLQPLAMGNYEIACEICAGHAI